MAETDAARRHAGKCKGEVGGGGAQLDSRQLSLFAALAAFALISALWAVYIPIPAATLTAAKWDGYNPDEYFHLRYAIYIAQRHALPPFGSSDSGAIYTAIHPPLYYACAALIYAAFAPFLPLPVIVVLLRLFGCAIGAGTVYIAYRAARLLLPHYGALLAAGIVAGVPMFVSLSGAVSNEVPAAFCATGALYIMLAGLRRGFTARRLLSLSFWTAAGIATKITCLLLLPTAFLALVLAARLSPNGTSPMLRPVRQMMMVMLICAALTGWWFVRNLLIYGDPLLANAHQHLWNAAGSATWRPNMTPWQFCETTAFLGWQSFWGIFDAFSRPLPDVAYAIIALIQIPAAFGCAVFMGKSRRKRVLRSVAIVFALFTVLLLALFYGVNYRFFSPQGRYLFPMLLPFGLATAVGWITITPRRIRAVGTGLLLAALLALNLFAFAAMSGRGDTAFAPALSAAAADVVPTK